MSNEKKASQAVRGDEPVAADQARHSGMRRSTTPPTESTGITERTIELSDELRRALTLKRPLPSGPR